MKVAELIQLTRAHQMSLSGEAATLRTRAGLTQAQVGAACGVSHAAVSRWESGGRLPRGKRAVRYARLLAALQQELEGGGA